MTGYYGSNINAEAISGSMTNRGAISQSLNASGSYTIPAGYHNGSGKVTANDLSSQTSADAAAGNILATKTAWVNGSQITGSMTNQGSKSTSLNAGGSYTIPAGYHDGTGKITANTLASQTAGTAAAGHILSGKTAWVAGSQLTGTLAVQNISSVTATTQSSSVIRISWKNPAKGPYVGVKIFMSTSGNPGTGGTAKYTGTGSSTTASGTSYVDITGLSAVTKYYFTVCAYVTNVGNGTSFNVNATTKAAAGSQTFTSSGTFTVPTGVTSIDIFCVGGGGAAGGARCTSSYKTCSSGGGGGYTATKKAYAVTPGTSFTVTIGAGGVGVAPSSSNHSTRAASGGTTSFGSVLSASGGIGSHNSYSSSYGGGAKGGSGGGSYSDGGSGRYGGSNGGNGYGNGDLDTLLGGGSGQGTTTRAFGETSGTLYAGGGGGGAASAYISSTDKNKNDGGDGGGGKGGSFSKAQGNPGTANTGGGAGGTGAMDKGVTTGANGGSGICLVRWS